MRQQSRQNHDAHQHKHADEQISPERLKLRNIYLLKVSHCQYPCALIDVSACQLLFAELGIEEIDSLAIELDASIGHAQTVFETGIRHHIEDLALGIEL